VQELLVGTIIAPVAGTVGRGLTMYAITDCHIVSELGAGHRDAVPYFHDDSCNHL